LDTLFYFQQLPIIDPGGMHYRYEILDYKIRHHYKTVP